MHKNQAKTGNTIAFACKNIQDYSLQRNKGQMLQKIKL